jgi:CBS domain-containing protein/PII-like signaling protein
MEPRAPAKKVTILLSNPSKSAYLKVLERLREHGVVNAFAFRTVAAIDARGELQSNRLAELAPDLPTIIVWIDLAEIVERILPDIRPLVTEGVITVDDTDLDLVAVARPQDLSKSLTVGNVMTKEVVSVGPTTAIREVVADLVTRSFRAVPVIDSDRRLVGIITNGDLVRRGGLPLRLELLQTLESDELHDRLAAMTAPHQQAEEIMTREVTSVPADLDIRHAADIMIRRRLKRLPVVDDEERLVGIVSRVDLLRSVALEPGAVPIGTRQSGPFSGETPLGEVLSRAVPAVSADATLSEVLNVILATRLNRAIVVDGDRKVLGIISDADVLERLDPDVRPGILGVLMHRMPFGHRAEADDEAYRHARARTAQDLMHRDFVVATETDTVGNVLAALLGNGKKVIVVVSDTGRLVGIVDRADLLRAIASL